MSIFSPEGHLPDEHVVISILYTFSFLCVHTLSKNVLDVLSSTVSIIVLKYSSEDEMVN